MTFAHRVIVHIGLDGVVGAAGSGFGRIVLAVPESQEVFVLVGVPADVVGVCSGIGVIGKLSRGERVVQQVTDGLHVADTQPLLQGPN